MEIYAPTTAKPLINLFRKNEIDAQGYKVIAEKVEIKGEVTWQLTFMEKVEQYQYPWQQAYYVNLSATSGELISIDIGR